MCILRRKLLVKQKSPGTSGNNHLCNYSWAVGKQKGHCGSHCMDKYKKVPRVVRSTLGAEAALSNFNSVDRLLWLRMMWAWLSDPSCEWSSPEKVLQGQTKADVVTDCRSMYDILTRTAVPSCSEHQTTIASSDQGRVERQL